MANMIPPDDATDTRRMKAILMLVATIGFVSAPFWSPGFGGFEPDQFPIPQDDPPVQPAGYAFAIWGVIYLWLLVSAGFGLIRRAEDAGWDAVRLPLTLSLVVGTPWIAVATVSPVWAGVLIWAMLICALWAIRRAPDTDPWLLSAPVELYAGWLTAASLVSLGLLGAGYGIGPDASGWAWTIVFVAVVAGTAIQHALARTAFYGAGVAWALAAVAVRNGEEHLTLALFAGLGAVAVAVAALRTTRREQNAT